MRFYKPFIALLRIVNQAYGETIVTSTVVASRDKNTIVEVHIVGDLVIVV